MLNRIIRADMEKLQIQEEKVAGCYEHLAGRGFTSRMVAEEIPPYADPLGKHNKLIIANGYLAGTTVSSANRLSIGAKSPLTGGIKESNAGGIGAYKMGRMNIRAIVLEGGREDNNWYVLVLNKDGCLLKKANYLAGKGVYEKAGILYQEFGKKIGLILIGPSGENLLVTAGITNNDNDGVPSRFSGRGGLGAVMGSKGVTAIVLDDQGFTPSEPVNKEQFNAKAKEFHSWILSNPQTNEVLTKYGTAYMMEITNSMGGLPTRNFFRGKFAGSEKINGQRMYETIKERGGEGKTTHACMPGCLVRCSNVFPDKDGKRIVSPVEYETMCLLGSNLEIDDLDTIAKMNYLCNDYGVDTMEIGCAIGVAMEAGLLPFGDEEAAFKLLQEVTEGTPLGRIIASGSVITGRVLGARKVPAVKGQGMAAYEPRTFKGTALAYATSPMGADHTAGNLVKTPFGLDEKDKLVEASRKAQVGMTMIDLMGFCMFIRAAVKDQVIFPDLINARYGWNLTLDDLNNYAGETLKTEWEYNKKAGFTEVHDRLPEYFYEVPNPDTGMVFDIYEENLKGMKA